MSRGTPNFPVRIREPLKSEARAKAETEGRTLTEVIVALLTEWNTGRITLPPLGEKD
jgi:hypothetical protein